MTQIVAFAPDLMDQSKLRAAFAAADFELVRSLDALKTVDADLILVDLGRPGVLGALPVLSERCRVIGFGSHVDDELLDQARQAGAEQVLARSVFFRRIPDLEPSQSEH